MYGQQPWYHNYPPNVAYNPYVHPAYQRPSPYDPAPIPAPNPPGYYNDPASEERRRALAEQRARRAQWLPDEVDEDEDWSYGNYGQPGPSYWEAKRRLQAEEHARRLREEALRRQEEQRRQQILLQKQREEEQARQQMWAEQRQQALKREEEERQRAAEQNKTAPDSHLAPANRGHGHHGRGQSHSRVRASKASSSEESTTECEPTPAEPQTRPEPTCKSQTPKRQPSSEEQAKASNRTQQQPPSPEHTLDQIASDFEKLKNNFVYPHKIDFQKPGASGEHISVPANRPPSEFDKEPAEEEDTPMDVDGQEGKLAYTSTNYALHAYVDGLDKLLMRLDGVESAGDKSIRERRRAIVKDIEKEGSKLERYWKQAWADYLKNNPIQESNTPASTASEPAVDAA